MSVEGVKNAIVASAKFVFEGTQQIAYWLGHKIQHMLSSAPKIKNALSAIAKSTAKIWDKSKPFVKTCIAFLRTGYGFASIGITLGAYVHYYGQKHFPAPEDDFARAAITTLAGAIIFGAGFVAATYGGIPII